MLERIRMFYNYNMRKNDNIENSNNEIIDVVPVPKDLEIEEIKAKYSKKTLNPFKNKKNQKLMKQEIDDLLKRREEARKKEEARLKELERKAHQKMMKESFKKNIKKNSRIYGIVATVLFAVVGCFCFAKYQSTKIKDINFIFSDETKYVGDFLDIAYTVEPKTAKYDEKEIEIVVSDPSLISPNRSVGNNVCSKEGTAIIKLIYNDKEYDSKTITIKPVLINKLYVPDIKIGHGNSLEINPIIEPENATNKDYILSIEDTNVAEINDHTITGLEIGQTVLHLKSVDGFSYDAKIDVIEIEPTQLKFESTISSMTVGDEKQLKVIYSPEETTLRDVYYYSSNSGVVSVSQEGDIVAKYPGEATITAKYNDEVYCENTITVKYPPAESIELSSKYNSLYVGDSTYLSCNINPSKNSNENITYASSDKTVLTVNDNGLITAIAAGKATITAYADNRSVKDSVEISVSERPVTRTVSSGSRSSSGGSGGYSSGGSGEIVYIASSGNGTVYHTRPQCGRMKNSTAITLQEAIDMGLPKCKNCP